MSRGVAAPKIVSMPGAQGAFLPEGDDASPDKERGGGESGGVFDCGAHEGDEPANWEALTSPLSRAGGRGPGTRQSPTDCTTVAGGQSGQEEEPPQG